MDTFIVFFLFHWWAMRIFYKLTDFDKADSKLRDKIKSDFLYQLLSCKLCMESHIGFLFSLPFVWYLYNNDGFAPFFLIGYASAGLMNILNHLIDA